MIWNLNSWSKSSEEEEEEEMGAQDEEEEFCGVWRAKLTILVAIAHEVYVSACWYLIYWLLLKYGGRNVS